MTTLLQDSMDAPACPPELDELRRTIAQVADGVIDSAVWTARDDVRVVCDRSDGWLSLDLVDGHRVEDRGLVDNVHVAALIVWTWLVEEAAR